MLFELVHSDWLFRMPTLHLAQAHAASGGRTFLYEVSYPASANGLGACHAIDVPLVFASTKSSGRCFRPGPCGQRGHAREPDALAVGGLRRGRRSWVAALRSGPPADPHFR